MQRLCLEKTVCQLHSVLSYHIIRPSLKYRLCKSTSFALNTVDLWDLAMGFHMHERKSMLLRIVGERVVVRSRKENWEKLLPFSPLTAYLE